MLLPKRNKFIKKTPKLDMKIPRYDDDIDEFLPGDGVPSSHKNLNNCPLFSHTDEPYFCSFVLFLTLRHYIRGLLYTFFSFSEMVTTTDNSIKFQNFVQESVEVAGFSKLIATCSISMCNTNTSITK